MGNGQDLGLWPHLTSGPSREPIGHAHSKVTGTAACTAAIGPMGTPMNSAIVQARVVTTAPLPFVCARVLRYLRSHELDEVALAAVAVTHTRLIRAGVAGITKKVAVQALEPVYGPHWVEIPIRWVATGVSGQLFPNLDANLELRQSSGQETELTLVGSYRPPFGRAGTMADHLVMRRVAERTLSGFLKTIIAIMTTEEVADPTPALRLEPVLHPQQ